MWCLWTTEHKQGTAPPLAQFCKWHPSLTVNLVLYLPRILFPLLKDQKIHCKYLQILCSVFFFLIPENFRFGPIPTFFRVFILFRGFFWQGTERGRRDKEVYPLEQKWTTYISCFTEVYSKLYWLKGFCREPPDRYCLLQCSAFA